MNINKLFELRNTHREKIKNEFIKLKTSKQDAFVFVSWFIIYLLFWFPKLELHWINLIFHFFGTLTIYESFVSGIIKSIKALKS